MDKGCVYHGYRTAEAERMCEMASMYSTSSTLVLMRSDPIFDDEDAPGPKSPSSSMALYPARARDQVQVQVQALRFV